MTQTLQGGAIGSALYRTIWRWHFFAGLICAPIVILLAVTGGIYLFKDQINDSLHADLRIVSPRSTERLAPSALVARALEAHPGTLKGYAPPAAPDRAAEVRILGSDGLKDIVYIDPYDGRVLGSLWDGGFAGSPSMYVVRKLHSLQYVGWFAERIVEGVAGWMVLMTASGIYLWWPRGQQKGGIVTVRGRPGKRLFWRDLHAVTGIFVSVAIVFLAMTGLPWSGYWGKSFYSFSYAVGMGMPDGYWDKYPVSTVPLKDTIDHAPWIVENQPTPLSTTTSGVPAKLDDVVRTVDGLGMAPGYAIVFPATPDGVFTASVYPNDITGERVVHLDQYSGKVLFDMRLKDLGLFGRLAEWGISIHMGQAFGLANQLILLASLMAMVGLVVSGTVMWWKRRPAGSLAAPRLPAGTTVPKTLILMTVAAGLFFPMVGISMLAFAAIEAAAYGVRSLRMA
ncbi:putative iron-regulated membrane protein [Azospirillum lipoferum]|uniref:PepSY domain-containing protein n=1 Tax=Azospirillum lipoferum TaxID=193 RepID=A0A5A9GSH0_AZOLI|nr:MULTISPECIES: PepSY domain-containing protein [Azospirillum]KAA0597286.1 PepSY domain-containing protein [Azospirillum lipoferum]MCP1608807.1 putative iron-regulated membrane protein [Azospirillum lipoferum]MDW5535878.1 PepSY domain-containing protein [Azospirillum sp. NL1]